MTTLVTGATGHVGANLVRELLRRGDQVRVLVRRGSRNAAVEGLDVEHAWGDVRDRASLDRALRDCDRLYHLAALISLRADQRRELFEVNVVGTRNVFAAAEAAGVARAVHCSSFGAVAVNPHGPSDETMTLDPFDAHLDYEVSKAVSEIEVLRAVARGMHAVIVNPSGVVGPYDFVPSPLGRMIVDFARGRLRAYVAGAFDFVAVDDVVAGHLLAMEKGRPGERYILGGEPCHIDDVLTLLQEITGKPRPRLRLPPRALIPLARLAGAVGGRLWPRHAPRFTPGSIRLLTSGKRADISKAQRELGYRPGPVAEAFRAAYRWFVEEGMVTR